MGPPHTTLLSAADYDFVREFQDSLSSEAANGRDCGGLLTAILGHLGHFKEQIHAESVGSQHDWGPVIAEAHGGSEVSISISIAGPGPEDHFQVRVSSVDDASRMVAFVAGVDAACRTMRNMHSHFVLVTQKLQELEAGQSRLNKRAESTVSEHIELLRQYNKVKDVGQQLIGLNADNRGVPVGSLYTDEHYGVGPND